MRPRRRARACPRGGRSGRRARRSGAACATRGDITSVNVAVCLPTYNERENLEPLVRRVLEVVPEARVYVIDDASPDGTGEVADRLAAADARVAVLHRPGKAGLGPAYVAGFRRALADGADVVFE